MLSNVLSPLKLQAGPREPHVAERIWGEQIEVFNFFLRKRKDPVHHTSCCTFVVWILWGSSDSLEMPTNPPRTNSPGVEICFKIVQRSLEKFSGFFQGKKSSPKPELSVGFYKLKGPLSFPISKTIGFYSPNM